MDAAGFGRTRGMDVVYRSARLSDFYVECAIVCLLLVYAFNCVRGKAKNEKLVRSWVSSQSPLITQNFAHVGDDDGNLTVHEGATRYILYASGRRYCQYMFVKMKLLPRQDMFGMFYRLFFPVRETLTIEIALDPEAIENFVFAVLPRKKALSLKKSRWDIENFTRQYAAEELPDSHVCLSEGPELLGSILDGRLVAAIRASGDQFEELIITDQPTEKPTTREPVQKMLTLTYHLSPNGVDNSDLLRAAIDLVDVVADEAKLRPETRTKGWKARAEARKDLEKEEMKDRQAALQQQKAEQRRKQMEKVSRMTPDQQRKWEEKERKKDLKKHLKQRMKLAK